MNSIDIYCEGLKFDMYNCPSLDNKNEKEKKKDSKVPSALFHHHIFLLKKT